MLSGLNPNPAVASVAKKKPRMRPKKTSVPVPRYVPMPKTINYSNDMTRQNEVGGSGAWADPSIDTVFMEPGYDDKFALAHEVGHIMDHQMTDADRARFQMILGFKPDKPWDSGTGESGYHSPSEWFADYYAAAATGLDLSKENVVGFATLTPKKLRRMINALDRMRLRYGLGNYTTEGLK